MGPDRRPIGAGTFPQEETTMDHVTLVQSRAAVLAGELERLRGIGIPLEFAAALLAKCLAADVPALARRGAPIAGPDGIAAGGWAAAGCADEG